MEETRLIVGRTYYRLTFADRDFTMPGVEPLVYLGWIELEDGKKGHAFQEAASYIRFGSALSQAEGNEECAVWIVEPSEIDSSILEVGTIAREVVAAANRAETLGHPSLPILRTGWKSAP